MGQFTPLQREAILDRMINRVVARTALTDVNDTSSLKQVLAASAREDDEQYYQMINLLDLFDIDKARGTDLDERAKEFNPALISRLQPAAATGVVVFSAAVAVASDVSIPIGTQVQVPAQGGTEAITFTTTTEGVITTGNTDSNNVSVECDQDGTIGNVAVGTLEGFLSKPVGVDTVTNPASYTNGAGLESDDSFRRRLLAQLKGLARCHIFGLEQAALTAVVGAQRVVFAQVIEDEINRGEVALYIDDGAGSAKSTQGVTGETVIASAVGGEVDIFLTNKPVDPNDTDVVFELRINGTPLAEDTDFVWNSAAAHAVLLPGGAFPTLSAGDAVTADYTYFDGLVQETQKIVDGDPADRTNYPGYRAAGTLVRVLTPSIRQQAVTANITVRQGYSQTVAATAVTAAISSYINALGIGDDIILNELRERSMAVPGMFDIRFTAPTENVIILNDELARIVAGNISVS